MYFNINELYECTLINLVFCHQYLLFFWIAEPGEENDGDNIYHPDLPASMETYPIIIAVHGTNGRRTMPWKKSQLWSWRTIYENINYE